MKRFLSLMLLLISFSLVAQQETVTPVEDSYCRYLGHAISVADPVVQVRVDNVSVQYDFVDFQYVWTDPNGNTWTRVTNEPIGSQNMTVSGTYRCDVTVLYYMSNGNGGTNIIAISNPPPAFLEVVWWCSYTLDANSSSDW